MTFALGVIIAGLLFSVFLVGYGVCRKDSDFVVGGAFMFIFFAICTFVREEHIDKNIENAKKYEMCVKQGKEVVIIFNQEVCKL